MRQSIRALGWTSIVITILMTVFIGTAVYSMVQTLMGQGFSISGFQPYSSEDGIGFSLLFAINNTGYYDISDLNLTTWIRDVQGTELSRSSTTVDRVPAGSTSSTLTHNLSITLGFSESLTYLLFDDGNFTLDSSVSLRYASAFSFALQIPNASMPWGAPLANLVVGDPTPSVYNLTYYLVAIPLTFDNHAFFPVSGQVLLDLYNSTRAPLGSGSTLVEVPPGSPYNGTIEILLPVEAGFTATGYVDLSFEDLMFSVGPVEYAYG